MLKNSKKGFTILELLVVVAIIAILAAVAIPSFIGKIDKSKDAADLAEINAVQKAVALYYVDNGNYPTLQGLDISLVQPQPVDGSPQNVDFSKLVPDYLAKLPHFSYWWVDYKGLVYHTQKPIGNVTSNVFTPQTGDTYTLYKGDGSSQVLSAPYTLQTGEYVLGKDDKGRDLPKISSVFKNEKQHPESPEYTGTGTVTAPTAVAPVASGDTATMLTPSQWAAFDYSGVKAPTGQTSANLGVDSWGNPVNMDLWAACRITDANYGTVGTICLSDSQNAWTTGYKGSFIGGKIIGQVPTKVKLAGDANFVDVTSLLGTFYSCTSLTQAPVIPNGVTSMAGTFAGCTGLTTAPVIPSGVINVSNTFFNCTSLTTAPMIPDGVREMTGTFNNCTSLVAAPMIPDSVTEMNYTFYSCTSLTAASVIPPSAAATGTYDGCTSLH